MTDDELKAIEDEVDCDCSQCCSQCVVLVREVRRLKADNKRLREAAGKLSMHVGLDSQFDDWWDASGLEAALEALR